MSYIRILVIQNTNNDVRRLQDISKSATEVTCDFAKWNGFQVIWVKRRRSKIPSDLHFKIGDRKWALFAIQCTFNIRRTFLQRAELWLSVMSLNCDQPTDYHAVCVTMLYLTGYCLVIIHEWTSQPRPEEIERRINYSTHCPNLLICCSIEPSILHVVINHVLTNQWLK